MKPILEKYISTEQLNLYLLKASYSGDIELLDYLLYSDDFINKPNLSLHSEKIFINACIYNHSHLIDYFIKKDIYNFYETPLLLEKSLGLLLQKENIEMFRYLTERIEYDKKYFLEHSLLNLFSVACQLNKKCLIDIFINDSTYFGALYENEKEITQIFEYCYKNYEISSIALLNHFNIDLEALPNNVLTMCVINEKFETAKSILLLTNLDVHQNHDEVFKHICINAIAGHDKYTHFLKYLIFEHNILLTTDIEEFLDQQSAYHIYNMFEKRALNEQLNNNLSVSDMKNYQKNKI